MLDTFSRRVVGWSIDSSPNAALVTNALGMAIDARTPDGTIIHSDHGSQFASWAFTSRAKDAGLVPSMGSIGDCYDCDDAPAAAPGGLTLVMSDRGVLALTCRPSGQQRSEWLASRASSDLIGA